MEVTQHRGPRCYLTGVQRAQQGVKALAGDPDDAHATPSGGRRHGGDHIPIGVGHGGAHRDAFQPFPASMRRVITHCWRIDSTEFTVQ